MLANDNQHWAANAREPRSQVHAKPLWLEALVDLHRSHATALNFTQLGISRCRGFSRRHATEQPLKLSLARCQLARRRDASS